MKAVVVFVLLLASVAATSRLKKMRARAVEGFESAWDIAEGISGAASTQGKVEGHEQSVRDAWNALSTADKTMITNPVVPNRPYLEARHTPRPMIMGLQMPDIPQTGMRVSAYGDDYTTPTHATAGMFGVQYTRGERGARDSFIAQTHFGCLQYWHAMAPEPYVGGRYKVWSNANLSQLIKNAMQRIWNVVVRFVRARNFNMAEFHLGRILHTIGDSYAKGHTARGPSACGPILVFQEYNAQKGNNLHAAGDKPRTNQAQFQCTVQRVKEVLQAYAGCRRNQATGCTYPTIIDSTFNVAPAVASLDAGGALDAYAGPEVKRTGRRVTVPGVAGPVWFPAVRGARVAGTTDVASSCPNF
jgi:hypothetical protein